MRITGITTLLGEREGYNSLADIPESAKFNIIWSSSGDLKSGSKETKEADVKIIAEIKRLAKENKDRHYQAFSGGPSSHGDHLEMSWMVKIFLRDHQISTEFNVKDEPKIPYVKGRIY